MAGVNSTSIRRHCTPSVAASQDLEACRFAVLVPGGADYPADGGRAIGIIQEGGAQGSAVSLSPTNGIHPVLASVDIPEGSLVASTVDGRAKVAAGGEQVLGQARETRLAGQHVSVMFSPSGEL